MSLPKCWKKLIQQQQQQDYFIALSDAIAQERAQGIEIYPKDQDIYNSFEYVDIEKIKVVILGQDPYHGVDQARGLAFSVSQNDKIPPSLVNIYKELQTDIDNFVIPQHGDLSSWAEQGVPSRVSRASRASARPCRRESGMANSWIARSG